MTKKTLAVINILIITAICAYYWLQWQTLDGFVTAIDHGDELFGDLVTFYYPMAKAILTEKLPVPGYYYSAFFALLISPFATLPIAQTKLIWGILQVLLAAVLGVVSSEKLLKFPRAGKAFFLFLFLTSFPLLHNFKWGQVSVLITLCVLTVIWFYKNEYYIPAGILLAFAVSIKYYPAIFIVYPLFKRNYRFLISFGLSTLTFLAVIPSIMLGPLEWVNFEKAVSVLIADAKFAGDVNSQYFGHVILRMVSLEDAPFKKKVLSTFLEWAGRLMTMVNIGIIWKMQKKQIQDTLILSTGMLFLSLPFIIETSWSHYFVYLPFFQTVIFVQSLQNFKVNKEFIPVLVLTVFSCMASSVFAFNLFPGWSEYNNAGMLFISNLLLFFAFYQVLWSRYENSADAN